MGRKSSIDKLPPQIREALDALIRDKRHTIDEITAHIQGMGGEVRRTAIGDYRQRMEERLAKVREAHEIAGAWVKNIGQEPDSKMGQLLAQLLSTVAFRTLADMQDQAAGAEPEEVMLLAKAIKDIASAQKTDHELRAKLLAAYKAEMQAKAAAAQEELKAVSKTAGLTEEAHAQIRNIILDMVA